MLHKIKLIDLGDEIHLPHATILTAIEEVTDTAITFNCRAGCCGSCVVEITSGIENISEKNDDELTFLQCLGYEGDKYRLACQCKVLGDIELKKAS